MPKWRRRKVASFAGIAATIGVALAACALPAAGPTSDQLEHPFDGPTFSLVKIDSRIVQILQKFAVRSFARQFHTRSAGGSYTMRPGDAIAITVYETGGSSLFGTGGPTVPTAPPAPGVQPGVTPAGVTTVPPQVIESDGTVTMPFVGRVQAAGRTPGQLGQGSRSGSRAR